MVLRTLASLDLFAALRGMVVGTADTPSDEGSATHFSPSSSPFLAGARQGPYSSLRASPQRAPLGLFGVPQAAPLPRSSVVDAACYPQAAACEHSSRPPVSDTSSGERAWGATVGMPDQRSPVAPQGTRNRSARPTRGPAECVPHPARSFGSADERSTDGTVDLVPPGRPSSVNRSVSSEPGVLTGRRNVDRMLTTGGKTPLIRAAPKVAADDILPKPICNR